MSATLHQLPVFVRARLSNLLRQVLNILDHHLESSVVEEDINLTHLLQRSLDDGLAVLHVGQVGGEEVALLSTLLNLLLRLLSVALFVGKVGNQAVGALHGEEDRGRAADTRVSSGDDGLLALELAGRLVELVTAIFGGDLVVDGLLALELGLDTWRGLTLGVDLPA